MCRPGPICLVLPVLRRRQCRDRGLFHPPPFAMAAANTCILCLRSGIYVADRDYFIIAFQNIREAGWGIRYFSRIGDGKPRFRNNRRSNRHHRLSPTQGYHPNTTFCKPASSRPLLQQDRMIDRHRLISFVGIILFCFECKANSSAELSCPCLHVSSYKSFRAFFPSLSPVRPRIRHPY